jgi:hypothetical protein
MQVAESHLEEIHLSTLRTARASIKKSRIAEAVYTSANLENTASRCDTRTQLSCPCSYFFIPLLRRAMWLRRLGLLW